jgi:spire-like protein
MPLHRNALATILAFHVFLNVLGFFLRFSSKSKSVDKSDEELQFPKEFMEDWSTMEVCVDCKKFISEIISSSRRSLVLANKRARLKRKTQSFYMSSPGPSEYCPSERTINEI